MGSWRFAPKTLLRARCTSPCTAMDSSCRSVILVILTLCRMPGVKMGSFCGFLPSHNRIGGDSEACKCKSCRVGLSSNLPPMAGSKTDPPYKTWWGTGVRQSGCSKLKNRLTSRSPDLYSALMFVYRKTAGPIHLKQESIDGRCKQDRR